MKTSLLLVVMVGVVPVICARAQNQQPAGDFAQTAEGQVLANVMGVWRREAAPKDATELSGDHQINKWSLKGRWLEGQLESRDGSDTAMVMTTYDTGRKTYVAYLFAPDGLIGTFLGTFDADTQQMTWIDRSAKGTSMSRERLTDPDTLEVKGSVQDSEGRIVKQWTERYTRKHEDNEKVAAMPKQEASSKLKEKPEAKVLAQYIGRWHSVLVFMGREKQIDYDTTWALGGRWLHAKISSSDGKDSLTMTTFDAMRQAYVTWSFSSDGTIDTWSGKYDAAACRMTWTRQSDKGGVIDVDQFLDDDTIETTSKNQDAAGHTIMEAAEHVKRR
jgi:hypothetical protein